MKEDQKTYIQSLPREMRQPTNDRLKKESGEASNILAHVWDGEVVTLVAMVRRDSREVAWAVTGVRDREHLLMVLDQIRDSSTFMKKIEKT